MAAALPIGWGDDDWATARAAVRALPHRVRALLMAGLARRCLPAWEASHPNDRRPHEAVATAEAWALHPTEANRRRARKAADESWQAWRTTYDAKLTAAAGVAAAAAYTNYADYADYADYAARILGWPLVYGLYVTCRGPEGVSFDPRWRSETAVALARGIAAERAFDRMPILADALEEAGCDNAEVLNHLRREGETFTLADWTLCGLLDIGEVTT